MGIFRYSALSLFMYTCAPLYVGMILHDLNHYRDLYSVPLMFRDDPPVSPFGRIPRLCPPQVWGCSAIHHPGNRN